MRFLIAPFTLLWLLRFFNQRVDLQL